jgi:hypothetical protein
MLFRTMLAAAALLSAAAAAQAATVPLAGVSTAVTVSADLTGLGLGGAPSGSATVDVVDGLPVFTFPITGGFIDTATGFASIEHDGSGVTLSALADPALFVTVGNFLIDTQTGFISGDVLDGAAGFIPAVPFFELGAATDLGLTLAITPELAGALTAVFGAPDLAGATFGFGAPDVAPVPLPGAFGLMLAGLGALGAARLRRRAA